PCNACASGGRSAKKSFTAFRRSSTGPSSMPRQPEAFNRWRAEAKQSRQLSATAIWPQDDSDHLAGALGRRDLDKAATPTGRRSDTSVNPSTSQMKESCVVKWSPDNARKTPH